MADPGELPSEPTGPGESPSFTLGLMNSTSSIPPSRALPLRIYLVVFAMYQPSYRCLASYLNQDGSDIRTDLLGDDQLEAIARKYHAEHASL